MRWLEHGVKLTDRMLLGSEQNTKFCLGSRIVIVLANFHCKASQDPTPTLPGLLSVEYVSYGLWVRPGGPS